MRASMTKFLAVVAMAASIFCAGCIGPHYTNKEVLVLGRQPPHIRDPHDPAIEAHLSTNCWAKSPFPDRAAEVVVTVAKSAGFKAGRITICGQKPRA